MSMQLYKPLSIFRQGSRDNMEDYILPVHETASETDRLFIVCDGMGGHARGEVASKLACEEFLNYFTHNPTATPDEGFFMKAFNHVQSQFDKYIKVNPDSRGMGTTVVMAYFNESVVWVIHCGDSRLYHFRGNQLFWRTWDHNMATELYRKGHLSLTEAMKTPKSNIITRAIQGHSILKTKPDFHCIDNLQAGDCIFLCTDGINEGLSDEQLTEIVASNHNDEEKINIIQLLCEGNARDNHSAFLIRIRKLINN